MDKQEVMRRLTECGVIAVVRAKNAEQAEKIADACIRAGIVGIEITFTVPGALGIIEALSKKYTDGQIIIGAGTVMDIETARAALLAGRSSWSARASMWTRCGCATATALCARPAR